MQQAGLQVLYIEDRKVLTTTTLLEKHGPEVLLRAKQDSYAPPRGLFANI